MVVEESSKGIVLLLVSVFDNESETLQSVYKRVSHK